MLYDSSTDVRCAVWKAKNLHVRSSASALGEAAQQVRRQFITDKILARKTAPKGAAMFVASCLTRDVRLIDGKRCARKGTAGTGQGRACEKDEGNLARRRGVGEARAGKQGTGSAYRRRRRIPQPRRSSWATRPSLCPTRAWTVARRALPVERETSSL